MTLRDELQQRLAQARANADFFSRSGMPFLALNCRYSARLLEMQLEDLKL